MFNVRLAGDHLYEKRLFTCLSFEMSLMRSGTDLSQFLGIFLPILAVNTSITDVCGNGS